ncbi:hypothetical protein BCR39DRAFT_556971 [Naematelia encephala]|uniref:Uncharacterized protein n=1 Tax=Naematelia encephala TaxID=71784 RepID=A0A1Y2BG05_9TREE|nr:hypothetical protein BCR39DRAFT_556971 [Naematelia encephala]
MSSLATSSTTTLATSDALVDLILNQITRVQHRMVLAKREVERGMERLRVTKLKIGRLERPALHPDARLLRPVQTAALRSEQREIFYRIIHPWRIEVDRAEKELRELRAAHAAILARDQSRLSAAE